MTCERPSVSGHPQRGMVPSTGLGSGKCGQHPCPPENRRACRPVQHEFYADVSGDSRVQWSDETATALRLGHIGRSLKLFHQILLQFLSTYIVWKRDHSTFSYDTPSTSKRDSFPCYLWNGSSLLARLSVNSLPVTLQCPGIHCKTIS
ncbi:hypothetical protein TNCV_4697351 [Trichonephila clavipes]|nr:hypothetical protein TNCV_4697351 [Trichonephila clavipes]